MANRHLGKSVLNGLSTLALVSGALLVGCAGVGWGRAPGAQTTGKARVVRSSSRARERLEREVRHELVLLPYYSVFDSLEFKVEGYRVILLGQTIRPTLKSDAGAVVKKIEGVEEVVNKIEVLPLSPNDDRIRRAVYRAIYSNAVLDRYAIQAVPPIHIIVKNGNVTLVGVVASEMERNVAYIQANGVSGVFSATNNLRVEK